MVSTTPTSRLVRGLAILFVLLVPAAPARAQFRQQIVNDDLTGEENRQDPALIGLDDGGFLLFWVDNGRAQQDILVRRFDPQLRSLAAPATVNDDQGITEQFGVVTSSARGGRAIATWLDKRESIVAVCTQLFRTDSGQPVGTNQVASRSLTGDRSLGLRDAPAAATSDDGTSLVCWEEGTYARRRIRCRLVDAEGRLPGAPIEVAVENPDRIQRRPAVAALPDGRWLTAWFETNGLTLELRFRLLAHNGDPSGTSTLAHTEPLTDAEQGPEPALLVRAEDALLVWVDNTEGKGDLYGRRMDLAGNLLGEPTLMRAAGDPSRDNDPRLRGASDGRFVLTWFGGETNRVYPHFRIFGADGQPESGDLTLTDQNIGVVPRAGTALALPGNEWLLAWTDDRMLSLQVYLRRVAADGSPNGPTVVGWSVEASASQLLPDLALLPDGRALVAWGDLRNGTFNIFARRLDHDGVPEGQSFQVNTLPLARRYSGPLDVNRFWPLRPMLAASASGRFVLVWTAAAGGGAQTLLGQLLDGDGQPVGDNFPIGDIPGNRGGRSDPRPAMAPDGSFVIAWHDDNGSGAGDQVLMQRYNRQGTPLGDPFTPVDSVGSPASQITPAIAISPFGDMVAAWVDRRRGSWDIYRMRLDQVGRPIEAHNQQMNAEDNPGNDQVNPSIATNGASIVTVWEDNPLTSGLIQGRLEVLETFASPQGGAPPEGSTAPQRGTPPGGGTERISADGTREVRRTRAAAAPIDFTVNQFDHPSGHKNPRVTMDDVGRFVVSWWDERDGQRRVWARRYDADGNPIEGPYSIIGGETHDMRLLAVAAANVDGIQYAWSDSRRGCGWDIYSRRVDWNYGGEATPVLLESWETSSLAEGLRIRWEVPLGITGALFRTWRDPEAGPGDLAPTQSAALVSPEWIAASAEGVIEIVDREPPRREVIRYFLEMSTNGTRGDFIGPVEARWDPPASVWSAGPNPFRGAVRLSPPISGTARVEIFDPAGRRLRILERADGMVPLEWDGCDNSGRVVASGVYLARVIAGGELSGTLRLVRVR